MSRYRLRSCTKCGGDLQKAYEEMDSFSSIEEIHHHDLDTRTQDSIPVRIYTWKCVQCGKEHGRFQEPIQRKKGA